MAAASPHALYTAFLCAPAAAPVSGCDAKSLPAAQVLSIAGELLSNAEGLLRDGLHTAEVADGYIQAGAKARLPPQATMLCSLHGHTNDPHSARRTAVGEAQVVPRTQGRAWA